MALTSLDNLKQFLSITDDTEDDLLTSLITMVSAAIEQYTGRIFGTDDYTEFYSGNGGPYLVLDQRPVTDVDSVYVSDTGYWGQSPDAFPAATLLTLGTDYALVIDQPDGSSRSGMLFRINGVWPNTWTWSPGWIGAQVGPQTGNIMVVYTAGFADIPADVQLACNMAIAKIRQSAQYGQALTSESYEEYSYALAAPLAQYMLSPEARSGLARYRDFAIA